MVELAPGIRRVTFPLPTRPGHVHAYLLRDADGWTLVDTGLALPDVEERLRAIVAALREPVVRIAITHFHPDHVGGAEVAAAVTGAPVWQGVRDYEQCAHVWGNPEWPTRIARWFREHGVPRRVADELIEQGALYAPFIRYAPDPRPLRAGARIGAWEVLELPGHADGHLCLLRDGELVSGDHLLATISPAVGLYPDSRPDPLGDYLDSLRRTIELAPRVAYPGHGEPIADPAGRALGLIEHHRLRLEATARALDGPPQTGYEVSL
ncbi:MAG: MBL fold metallo-hydrolase, partial [Gaiellaceae bacterium]